MQKTQTWEQAPNLLLGMDQELKKLIGVGIDRQLRDLGPIAIILVHQAPNVPKPGAYMDQLLVYLAVFIKDFPRQQCLVART